MKWQASRRTQKNFLRQEKAINMILKSFLCPVWHQLMFFSRVFFFYKAPYPIGTKVFLVMSRKAILVLFSADIKVIAKFMAFWFVQL